MIRHAIESAIVSFEWTGGKFEVSYLSNIPKVGEQVYHYTYDESTHTTLEVNGRVVRVIHIYTDIAKTSQYIIVKLEVIQEGEKSV